MSIGVEVETRRAVTFVSTKEVYDDGTGSGGLVRDADGGGGHRIVFLCVGVIRHRLRRSAAKLKRNENGGKK